MSHNLFDIGKIVFTDRSKYSTISENDKNSAFFMFNRFVSKGFPYMAQQVNRNGIYTSAVMDMWFKVFEKFGNRLPSWWWAKSKKTKNQIVVEDLDPKVDRLVVQKYMELNKIGIKEFELAMKFNKKELRRVLKAMENSMKTYEP